MNCLTPSPSMRAKKALTASALMLLEAQRPRSAAALTARSGGRDVGWNALCTPDMGMNLWGESPL